MDIRIGMVNTARELSFESDETAKAVEKKITSALAPDSHYLILSDAKGAKYIIPTINLAYVELGSDTSRRVGFVA